jgi:hypothetical protein
MGRTAARSWSFAALPVVPEVMQMRSWSIAADGIAMRSDDVNTV